MDTEVIMMLSDTGNRARETYFRRLGEMTPSERIGIAAALWSSGDALQRAATRRAFPQADDAEVNFRIAVTRFGPELANRVYRKR